MTKSEKAFLERYTNAAGEVTTTDIAIGILTREVMKLAIKKEEKVELGEPEAYDITKKISMNEDNLMASIKVLEEAIRKSRRNCNSFEQWDEEVYESFREFKNSIYRIKDK